MPLLRVAVLYGGRSGEHEISLRSAESIIAGLDPAKYDVQRIFITPEGRWQPRALSPEPGGNPGIDVVFPALHGTFGEDGTVQGLLELAGSALRGCGRAGFRRRRWTRKSPSDFSRARAARSRVFHRHSAATAAIPAFRFRCSSSPRIWVLRSASRR